MEPVDAGVFKEKPRPEPVVVRVHVIIRAYLIAFGVFWFGFQLLLMTRMSFSEAPFAIVMMALGGVLFFRLGSQRVVADDSGLLVRNLYRTWRFGVDEVEGFRLGRTTMGMPFGKVIHALLRNGEVITMDVTATPWSLSGRVKQEQVLRNLRAWIPRRT